jgi:hypothetical protein
MVFSSLWVRAPHRPRVNERRDQKGPLYSTVRTEQAVASTRSKTTRGTGRTGAGRAGARRPAARPRRELPLLPMVVAGVFLVVFAGLVIAYQVLSRTSGSGSNGQPVAGIECNVGEQLSTHYHAHLTILYHNQPATVPGQVGITTTCLYWMHTHDASGVIHVEAPKSVSSRVFTLGDFFQVWNQPLSKSQVATFKVGSGDQLKMWVDGKPYTGDPRNIVLKSHTQVVVQIGPPITDPPPTFDWSSPEAVQEAGTAG